MDYNFTSEQPVLNFGPRKHARWSSREFVLWPAWAYRVVAPRVRRRRLNMLQRAVMGLCQASVVRIDTIAEHISLHPDLVAFIVTELKNQGYLDGDGLPTDDGLLVLENDAIESEEMVAGYVFQDPWNGDLWPRFVEQLDYCELDFNDAGFPSLLMGTTGKPRREHAFTVLPRTQIAPRTPNAREIVRAVAQHRTGMRFRAENHKEEEPPSDFVNSDTRISRVSFIEEEPQPVFLMTYLYVPEEEAIDWYACDPFGFGQSARLRRRVEAVMREDTGLFALIDRLVGRTLHDGFEEQKNWFKNIELQARQGLARRFTLDIQNHAAFEQLLQLESARQEMLALKPDCPTRKINELLRAGVKVLEAVFASLSDEYSLRGIWKRVYVEVNNEGDNKNGLEPQSDSAIYAATYEGAYQALKFAEPFPNALLRVKPGQIRSVADYENSWRLRPLITATAMLAQRDPTHPFAIAASQSPEMLNMIDEIASVGGAAGHANSDRTSPDVAEQHVEKVYNVVSRLIGV